MVHKSYSFYYSTSGHNVMLETIYYIETYIIIIMHYIYYAFNTYTGTLGAAAVFFQYEV